MLVFQSIGLLIICILLIFMISNETKKGNATIKTSYTVDVIGGLDNIV